VGGKGTSLLPIRADICVETIWIKMFGEKFACFIKDFAFALKMHLQNDFEKIFS